jgi:hypothetical protein
MENKTFYMVYVEGRNTPTVKHETYEQAHDQAIVLSIKERVNTYVLKAKTVLVPVTLNKKLK